jgi:hypothetical protein
MIGRMEYEQTKTLIAQLDKINRNLELHNTLLKQIATDIGELKDAYMHKNREGMMDA